MDDHFNIMQAEQRRVRLPVPYNSTYEWGKEAAKREDLVVVNDGKGRRYGYELHNKVTGSRAMWFKRRHDAIKKIHDLKGI